MKGKFNNVFFVVLVLLFAACSSGNERLIRGKWSLAGSMVGGSPTSFWFKGNGTVVAPWETHRTAMQSSGTYELIDDTHIKIKMKKGYYEGNIYYLEIIKLDKEELILKTGYQDIRMKRN